MARAARVRRATLTLGTAALATVGTLLDRAKEEAGPLLGRARTEAGPLVDKVRQALRR